MEFNTSLDALISKEELYSAKKERLESQGFALEGITTVSQVFVIVCAVRGDPVWRAFLAIVLFGFSLMCYKRWSYRAEKPWGICSSLCLAFAAILSIRFFIGL